MIKISKLAGAMLLGAGAIALSGCATGLPTQVSRYQQMPAPAGQTFYVVPADGQQASLEFGRNATIVAKQLEARGYRPAGAPQAADMLVTLDYGVDQGSTQVETDPFLRSRLHDPYWGSFYGRPYYSRYGYWGRRSPFYYGWDDPFWYRSGYYGPGYYPGAIRSYTVYKSFLDMDIVRRADNIQLFQGHVKARSQTDELGALVPNLVEAMFTDFPGRSGETVKITVPARKS
jgi:hypothetical protein